MPDDLVTELLPTLGRSRDLGFNVFEVMHHGGHEKQISNVFRWLLNSDGTHNLGDRFTRIFVNEVNRARIKANIEGEPFRHGGYWVSQEVNTSWPGEGADIADLVLESETAVLVIENYFISDGHGHDACQYMLFAVRDGRDGAVVLLCQEDDPSRREGAWKHASVVTYRSLVERLFDEVEGDGAYREDNRDAYSFIAQMYRKYVKGKGPVDDQDVLKFVIAMCDTGEARRYGGSRQGSKRQFGEDMAELAGERFDEGRELLQRIKDRVKTYSEGPLSLQLDETFGKDFVRDVNAMAAGIYRWTIGFKLGPDTSAVGEAIRPAIDTDDGPQFQIKFGPSAWYANEEDPFFKLKVDPETADYSRLFITRLDTYEIRQSVVTLQEVLDGLDPTDHRLHDEIVRLLGDS